MNKLEIICLLSVLLYVIYILFKPKVLADYPEVVCVFGIIGVGSFIILSVKLSLAFLMVGIISRKWLIR